MCCKHNPHVKLSQRGATDILFDPFLDIWLWTKFILWHRHLLDTALDQPSIITHYGTDICNYIAKALSQPTVIAISEAVIILSQHCQSKGFHCFIQGISREIVEVLVVSFSF